MRRDSLKQGLLLDYYGELLTQKQRLYCDLYYNQDYSLAEIAEETGISRQGVWDNIRRADAALEELEEMMAPHDILVAYDGFERILGCAARDSALRALAQDGKRALSPLLESPDPEVRERARQATEIITTMEGSAE